MNISHLREGIRQALLRRNPVALTVAIDAFGDEEFGRQEADRILHELPPEIKAWWEGDSTLESLRDGYTPDP